MKLSDAQLADCEIGSCDAKTWETLRVSQQHRQHHHTTNYRAENWHVFIMTPTSAEPRAESMLFARIYSKKKTKKKKTKKQQKTQKQNKNVHRPPLAKNVCVVLTHTKLKRWHRKWSLFIPKPSPTPGHMVTLLWPSRCQSSAIGWGGVVTCCQISKPLITTTREVTT